MSAERKIQNPEADRLAAARDPGAVPRRRLKRDDIAVIHSTDLDEDPISELHEDYADDVGGPAEKKQEKPAVNSPQENHRTIP